MPARGKGLEEDRMHLLDVEDLADLLELRDLRAHLQGE